MLEASRSLEAAPAGRPDTGLGALGIWVAAQEKLNRTGPTNVVLPAKVMFPNMEFPNSSDIGEHCSQMRGLCLLRPGPGHIWGSRLLQHERGHPVKLEHLLTWLSPFFRGHPERGVSRGFQKGVSLKKSCLRWRCVPFVPKPCLAAVPKRTSH